MACARVEGMPTSAADLLSAAYNDADRTIDLRRRLHRHPEIVRARLIDLLPAVAESVSPPSDGAWDVLGLEDGALG